MALSKFARRSCLLFTVVSLVGALALTTTIVEEKKEIDITEVQRYVYEPEIMDSVTYNMTVEDYLSRNPRFINDIVANRLEEQVKELEVKEAEMQMVKEFNNKSIVKSVPRNDDFYIEEIKLEYPDEEFNFGYEMQEYVYSVCQEFDLDYWLIMGVIARESRFTFADKETYCGYMGVGEECAEFVRQETGDESLDRWDEYDNIYIGCFYQKYCFDVVGSTDGGLMAYNIGIQGYYNSCAEGVYTNNAVAKAWKFRKLLYERKHGNGSIFTE